MPLIPKTLLEELTGYQVLNCVVEEGSKPGDGYMSVLYSVSAEVILPSADGGEPKKEMRHFLFKCFPTHPARQTLLRTMNVFHKELSFYQVWRKALHDFQVDVVGLSGNDVITPAFPPCFGGKAIDFTMEELPQTQIFEPLDNFIVMENLKKSGGFQMVDKAAGLDLDHLNLAIVEIAKMHALGWAYKSKVEWNVAEKFPFLQTRFEAKDRELYVNVVNSTAGIALKVMDGALGEGNRLSKSTKAFMKNVPKIVAYFLEQDEETEKKIRSMHRSPPDEIVDKDIWRIQIHGDTFSDNMLFKYDGDAAKPTQVILLDFQMTREACPTVDLVNLIYTATTAQFRKLHLDSLLQLYCEKFIEICEHLKAPLLPGFRFDSLRRKFHCLKLFGFMIAILRFPTTFLDTGKELDMEQVGEDTDLEELMTDAMGNGALESNLYWERIVEVAQDLYDDGVI